MSKSAIRGITCLAVCTAACLLPSPNTASATVMGYVSNPSSNSVNWTNAITTLGASVDTDINFNTMPTGTLNGSFYNASEGVTISANPLSGVSVAASCCGNGFGGNNTGEGAWTPSKLLYVGANGFFDNTSRSITFSFNNPTYGAGIFLVDYGGFEAWTITARNSSNVVVGSYQTPTGNNFQKTPGSPGGTDIYKYFMGIVSTAGDIQSVTFSRPSNFYTGDNVGLDDFRFATVSVSVPEPMTVTLLATGLLSLGLIRRRRTA